MSATKHGEPDLERGRLRRSGAWRSSLACASTARACDPGPDYSTDDPSIPATLSANKKYLKQQGYPDKLIGLPHVSAQCVARIRMEPDGFHLIDVAANDTITSLRWDEDQERVARKRLQDRGSVRYGTVSSRRTFLCYIQPPYDQQDDCVASDDLNSSGAIKKRFAGRGDAMLAIGRPFAARRTRGEVKGSACAATAAPVNPKKIHGPRVETVASVTGEATQ